VIGSCLPERVRWPAERPELASRCTPGTHLVAARRHGHLRAGHCQALQARQNHWRVRTLLPAPPRESCARSEAAGPANEVATASAHLWRSALANRIRTVPCLAQTRLLSACRGSFAVVKVGVCLKTGERVALKVRARNCSHGCHRCPWLSSLSCASVAFRQLGRGSRLHTADACPVRIV